MSFWKLRLKLRSKLSDLVELILMSFQVIAITKPAMYLFMEIQKIDNSYYPETLHKPFIINDGSGFKMLWKAVKTFLDVCTVAKVQEKRRSCNKTLHKMGSINGYFS
ncbi:Phosphatidylinositol/phosphatidylcholine transfer protein [Arachis hypogaea]|nr:Phosphatidylinositol/phosphatidylcholine transfer protein [Arachis hypogaea]